MTERAARAARVLDLFADLDAIAREYGWAFLGQPAPGKRRYGKSIGGMQVTLRAYANLGGTALLEVRRDTVDVFEKRTSRVLGHRHGGKRDQMIEWLRFAEKGR